MIDQDQDRTKFLGGSEISGVMGMSRWTTPLEIWAKKTGAIKDNFEMNEAVEMGNRLEDMVCELFEEKSGIKVEVDETTFRHPDYDFLVAHLDRRIVGGGVFEAKTCSAYKVDEWLGEEIPSEYYLQVNFYMGILAEHIGYIAVLVGGQKFIWKKVDFSQELFDKQVEMAVTFWRDYVLTDTPPFAISSDQDTLMAMFPESRPDSLRTITDPDEETNFNNLAIDYLEGRQQIKEIEKEVNDAANKIKQLIEDSEGLETGMFKSSWRSFKRKSVNIEALKAEGLYEGYTVEKDQRSLRILEKKSKPTEK